MSLIRRENREVARRPQPQAGWDPFRMMNELLSWDPFRASVLPERFYGPAVFIPSFDVKETKDAYVVRADLPGVKEDDLDISLAGNVLQISGHREEEKIEDGDRPHVVERSYGQFTRSFSLPEGADPDHVQAELKQGVLTVHIAKRAEVQPKRITVGKGDAGGTAAKS